MAKKLPAYILKDINLWLAGESQIGQLEEMAIPAPEVATEAMRNAGMVKPRKVHMGYEGTEFSFSLSSFDPKVQVQLGSGPGNNKDIIGYGYFQDDDGTEHAARIEMVGFVTKLDPGTWKTGDKASNAGEFTVHEHKLFMDDELLVDSNDFDVVVGGVSATPGRGAALRAGG